MSLLSDAVSSLLSSDDWSWTDHLKQASFRGVEFGVLEGDSEFGRSVAVHDYPYRDQSWVEDIGRPSRRITLQGFLVQGSLRYSGSDVLTQRDSLIAACETAGAGKLVHPTLGEMTVSIPPGGLRIRESLSSGRAFYFTLTCIESGLKVFAITSGTSDNSSVSSSYLATLSAAAVTVLAEIKSNLRTVTQAIKTIQRTVAFWGLVVDSAVDEVTNLSGMLNSTFGSTRYGRYSNGDTGGNTTGATATTTVTDDTDDYDALVAEKTSAVAQNREEIVTVLDTLDATSSIDDLSDNVEAVITAILDVVPTPADRVTTLETISAFSDSTTYASTSDASVQSAVIIYLQCCCATAIAVAAADYQPSSYDDAISVMQRVTGVMDDASLSAADAGYDDIYVKLQKQRHEIMVVMQEKGATLAPLQTITLPASLPALTIAQRLYQDANREAGLIKSTNPVHPAFMPVSFKALAS